MKRTLVIVAIAVLVIGLLVGLYFLFFAPTAHLTVGGSPFSDTGSGTAASEALPPAQVLGNAGTMVAPNLVKITDGPVSAGVAVFDIAPPPPVAATSSATSTASSTTGTALIEPSQSGDVDVRYIDRASGNIYDYLAVARSLTRISNKTLPGIQEASWLPGGSMAFVRFLAPVQGVDQVDTYALPSNGNGGYFLEEGLDQVTVVGSTTVFTLADSTDSSVGSIGNADGTNVQTVFSSPLTSLIVQSAGNSLIATTKATSELDGYAFTLSNGNFLPILGPLRGLTTLPSPDGKNLFYSYTDGSVFHLGIYNLATGVVTNLPLATLADKCVWTSDSNSLYCAVPTSLSGNLPDDWYQGAVSFTDQIWRIDLTSRLATLVLDPSVTAKTDIDAVNLSIDPNSQLLVFRNKKDGSLWAYSL
jgi:hypothetical protein